MNASAIHSAILAAAAIAPKHDERAALALSWEAQQSAAYCMQFSVEEENIRAAAEFLGFAERTGYRPPRLDYETRETIEWAQTRASEAALSELCHCAGNLPPSFVSFQTSARGRMKVRNTRARLLEFAKQVKANQRAFGGGIAPTRNTSKPAQTWRPQVLKVIREAMQDRLYADALHLAEDKAGALFYPTNQGDSSLLIIAPVDVPELSGMVSALRANDGRWIVMHQGSGRTVGQSAGSRASAVRDAIAYVDGMENGRARLAERIAAVETFDQAQTRAGFAAHFGIVDEAEAGRIAAEAVANAQASAAEACATVADHAQS